MPGLDAPSHWVIIAIVVIVLFGYKKLPEMSRSLGRSLRIFKTEMKGLSEDDNARSAETVAPVVPPAPPAAEPSIQAVAQPDVPAPTHPPAPVHSPTPAHPAAAVEPKPDAHAIAADAQVGAAAQPTPSQQLGA